MVCVPAYRACSGVPLTSGVVVITVAEAALSVLLVAAGILHGLQGGVVIGGAGCAAGMARVAHDDAHGVVECEALRKRNDPNTHLPENSENSNNAAQESFSDDDARGL